MPCEAPAALIVVFGAAVRPDGSPSPALARRTAHAAAAAQRLPDAMLFLSGAKGQHGRAEARVMAELLDGWVAPERLHLDTASRDTLQTVRAAVAFAREQGSNEVWSCTDSYHQPRVRMLFALAGVRCRPVPAMPKGDARTLRRARLREAAAIPYDFIAGLGQLTRDRLLRRLA